MLRRCTQCGEEKDITRFVRQSGKYRSDPYRKDCKDCKNFRRREKIKTEPKSWNRGAGKSRRTVSAFKWKNAVLERDNFTCQQCGKTESLHCHHIIPWKEREDLRFDVNNGKTLCQPCHMSFESKLRAEKGDSEETKKRKSESHKGQKAWNKGIPRTEAEKKNQSEKMKGKPSWNKGKTGLQKSWNKGLKKDRICPSHMD
jgi:5-methylcytosine-specific restriction endonuclease McrA